MSQEKKKISLFKEEERDRRAKVEEEERDWRAEVKEEEEDEFEGAQQIPDPEEIDKLARSLEIQVEAPPPPPPPPPAARTGKMPYPVDIISEEELLNAGAPDWECITPGSFHKYKRYLPTVFTGMLDQLEPHTYWVNEFTDQEYSTAPYYIPPRPVQVCNVKRPRAYLALSLQPHDVVILIIFDGSKYSPHEVLALGSQQYDREKMRKDDDPFYREIEDFEIFLFYRDLPEEFMAPGTEVRVSFNERELHTLVEGFNCEKLVNIKNNLYEQLMLHVWSHFYLDTPQADDERRGIQEKIFFMKFAFWD